MYLQPTEVDLGALPEDPDWYDNPDPPFDPSGSIGAARREERINQQKANLIEYEEAKLLARAEREAAELSGALSPEAEAFRDLKLKPRIVEMHAFAQKVRVPIVQGLLFRDTIAWIAGASGTFKSFVTADLAFRYGAEDMDYHGRLMTTGRTLLVIAEGSGGYADRRAAWEKQYGREVKNVMIYPAPLQLADTMKEMPALISYMREEAEAGREFGLVVFDTQAMCTQGVDENTSDMNRIIGVMHRIREVNGSCVLTVHHYGKKKDAGMRGSSMIYAAADTVISVIRENENMEVTLSTAGEHGKQKDAPTEEKIVELSMSSHVVGQDFFGKPLTSLAAVTDDTPTLTEPTLAPEAPKALPKVTETQMTYLKALSFFRHHGSKQTDLARHMKAQGVDTYGSLVRSTMVGLEDKGLTEVDRGGLWKVTPLGESVLMEALMERARIEQEWLGRGRRRKVPSDVSEGQENIDHGTFGTSSEPQAETSPDLQRNIGT